MPILTLFTNKRKRSKARQLVIIDMRNIIGCDAIAEYGDKGDVISVWGGGHIPGMVHFLLQMNYEVIATDWHDVIDGNKYSLWGAIRDTLKATKENSKNKAELKKPPTD